MKVEVRIGGIRVTCLLDSGAGVNVINRRLLKQMEIKAIDSQQMTLRYANGERFRSSIVLRMSVYFLGKEEDQFFVVTDHLPADVVLGLGFWVAFHLIVETEEKNIIIRRKESGTRRIVKRENEDSFSYINTIAQTEEKETKIFLASDITLHPGHEEEASCSPKAPADGIITVSPQTMARYRLVIIPPVCVTQDTRIKVKLISHNNQTIELKKGTTIGLLHPLTEINIWTQDAFGDKDTDFDISKELSAADKDKVRHLLVKNSDLFAASLADLPGTHILEHEINLLPGSKPVFRRPYRLANIERTAVTHQLKTMLDAGIIEPAETNFSSPFLFVKKKNGSLRFVSDFRELNKITIKDVYTLPRIDSMQQALGGHKFFTTMDLFSGFFQMFLKKEDRFKTGFLTDDGLFQYVRMPQGLVNSPAKFQRLLDIVLSGLIPDRVVCYVDDLLVFGSTIEEHNKNLESVFHRLREASLRLSKPKSRFAYSSLCFLGVIISEKGFSPDPAKVEAMKSIPTPKSVSDVRSLLGSANYYRSFVPNFSSLVHPLTQLTKKDVLFEWTKEHEDAKQKIITALTSSPLLVHLEDDLPLYLVCDASGLGIGSVLCHVIEGEERPITFHSRSLNRHEMNYTVSEKELLAIIHGVKKNRQFLVGRQFIIVTDHHSLCFLFSLKDPHGRLARMALYLSNYEFKVEHRKGKDNCVADCLSRHPLPETLPLHQDTDLDGTLIMTIADSPFDLYREQQQDNFCRSVIESIGKTSIKRRGFHIRDHVLYRRVTDETGLKDLIVIPKSLLPTVLRECHDARTAGHYGVTKTYIRVHQRFYRPKLWRICRRYVVSCDACQKRKPRNERQSAAQQSLPVDSVPFRTLAFDYKGPINITSRENSHIIVMMDIATRWCEAKACKRQNGEETVTFMSEIFLRFGFPAVVFSDKGSPFLNQRVRDFLSSNGVKQRNTTAHNPQSNGLVEQMNKNIGIMLAILSEDSTSWDLMLPFAVFAHNSSVVESIGMSPYERLFGCEARIPLDNMLPQEKREGETRMQRIRMFQVRADARIREWQQKSAKLAESRFKHASFAPGDRVLFHRPQVPTGLSKTLYSPWTGPWTVTKKMSSNTGTYEIELNGKTHVTNVRNLRRYVSRDHECTGPQFHFNQSSEIGKPTENSVSGPEPIWQITVRPSVEKGNTSAGQTRHSNGHQDQQQQQDHDANESSRNESSGVESGAGGQAPGHPSTGQMIGVPVRIFNPEELTPVPSNSPPRQSTRVSHQQPQHQPVVQDQVPEQQNQPSVITRSGRNVNPPVRYESEW